MADRRYEQLPPGPFLAAAEALLEDRLVSRTGGTPVTLTVADLTAADVAALTEAGERLGVPGGLVLERAEPTQFAAWEALRQDILRLQDVEPSVLQGYPMPDPGYRRPPVALRLHGHAEAVAADLHARYGDFVALTVGALPYPPRPDRTPLSLPRGTPIDPRELTVELDGPLSVRSGDTARHRVLVTNHRDVTLVIGSGRGLHATIVDPITGEAVGVYTLAERYAGGAFEVLPTSTRSVPILVGTASLRPELGFTVPAGEWAMTVLLRVGAGPDRRELRSGPLPVTVT